MTVDFSKNKFAAALVLERISPRRTRSKIIALLSVVILFLIACGFLLPIGLSSLRTVLGPDSVDPILSILALIDAKIVPLLFVLVPALFFFIALESFWNAKTFDKDGFASSPDVTARLNLYPAELWGNAFRSTGTTRSIFEALLDVGIGRSLLVRLGIDRESYKQFVASGDEWKSLDDFAAILDSKKPAGSTIDFPDFVQILFGEHPAAKSFLDSRDITLEVLSDAALWMKREYRQADFERRWWLWENLARIPGVGKEWSYGLTPILQQYAHDMEGEALRSEQNEMIGKDREIKLVESALLKDSGANVILVGEAGAGKHTTLLGLVRMIAEGTIFPDLEDKRVFSLNGPTLVAAGKSKADIEGALIELLNEAVHARNIILTIDEFPEFVDSLSKVGVNASEILSPYLAHPSIHILALADTLGFRKVLENDTGLMKYFERIDITEPDKDRLEEILEDHVPRLEYSRDKRIVISYQAVERIAQGAIENLVAGALPKRAIDLMEEVANDARGRGLTLVMPDIVEALITEKTKIPLGQITKDEQDKLLHLEEFLRERVIGQEEAVKAVADAIRRARSGIGNPKRPIGTFLFMGPTGVGKTETAKALAQNYFGSEDAMLRFDMTEYQTEEGFEKLVGSFEKNEPGLLTSRMHASPYALVLLDEFEKSNIKVKNLFLQVLDEGFFTDYLGRKVNMRNTIIIATSNAGAKMIWESVEKGVDPSTLRKDLFDSIQKDGIYTPELLNRFDAVIIYHPLSKDVLAKIARGSLQKFAARLLESKNITLQVTDPLVDATAKGGYDPVFGARPMQRFLQDKVEKLVADKIIKGEVKSGSNFAFSSEEVATLA